MDAVQFDDTGRTFTCEPGSSPATPGVLWWWVSVSGEPHRYAAFRYEPTDTPASVKPRILSYYAQILADRARPAITRSTWAQRKPTPEPGATG
jgi:hypothetical protein